MGGTFRREWRFCLLASLAVLDSLGSTSKDLDNVLDKKIVYVYRL